MHKVEPLGSPGYFFEAPRWHDGRWWVSDVRGQVVRSFAEDGESRDELRLEDDRPSGLGWMPDGSLLIVSMMRRLLLRLRPGETQAQVHADLSALCGETEGFLNDMVIDAEGRAYIGFDADFGRYGPKSEDGMVLRVDPDGRACIAGKGLMFPNGMVIEDGRLLIVAETMGGRFSSFAIGPDGTLGPRTTWADITAKVDRRPAGGAPFGPTPIELDGCDLDAQSHIWVADLRSDCLRIAPDGAIVDEVVLPSPYNAWACALGGEDGKTLLICGANHDYAGRLDAPAARLFTARVDVPGAAWKG